MTINYARQYADLLRNLGREVKLLDLTELQPSYFAVDMYSPDTMSADLRAIQEEYILAAEKFAILVPEYNGSYPGILKLFVDGISVNEYSRNWKGKVTALVGIASGRAGNLRGIDHLAQTLTHMSGWVLPNRLPISLADQHLSGETITDAGTLAALSEQAQELILA